MEFEAQHYIDPCPQVPLSPEFKNHKTIDGSKTFFQSPDLPGVTIEFNCFDFRDKPETLGHIFVDRLVIQIAVLSENKDLLTKADKFIPRCLLSYLELLSKLTVENGLFILITEYSKNKERVYRKFSTIFETIEEIGIERNIQVPIESKLFIWFHTQ